MFTGIMDNVIAASRLFSASSLSITLKYEDTSTQMMDEDLPLRASLSSFLKGSRHNTHLLFVQEIACY